MKRSIYTMQAIFDGIISMIIILLGTMLLGKFGGYEAKVLIKN